MKCDPLEHPAGDCRVLAAFRRHFRIRPDSPPRQALEEVARAFARIPYENLTKIVKHAAVGAARGARRTPAEVIGEHVTLGAGGTCFSLTAALLHILRAMGWEADPILADRRYGPDTHCAVLVRLDGRPHLLDPGFLIFRPAPLDGGPAAASGWESLGEGLSLKTPFQEVRLVPRDGGDRLDLVTRRDGQSAYRLTFKAHPADAGEFLRAWDASFDWDMMQYPLVTRLMPGRHVYLQNTLYQVKDGAGTARRSIRVDDLPRLVEETFGVSAEVARKALGLLAGRGAAAT